MTVSVSSEIFIDGPVDVVAGYAMDPDNAPVWYVNIKSVEWKSPPPLRMGSQLAFTAQFLGRRLVYTYEIVELAVSRRLVMRTAEGPFPMETTYEFEGVSPHRTRMVLRNRGSPSGFSSVLARVMSYAIRRANRKDLARLKRVLEAPHGRPGQ